MTQKRLDLQLNWKFNVRVGVAMGVVVWATADAKRKVAEIKREIRERTTKQLPID